MASPEFPYFFMGEAEGKMNDLGSAHYYLGQHYFKKDDPKNARFHLNKALGYEKNPEQIKKIKELLKELDESESFFGRRERQKREEDGSR